ncbi:LysR family transcriptional regulator [Latilactobacillus curvatus]|uniref:LysR family transcriptional regulator n=1 Tax=Latilactobacillus curvatus TaxID=28038 RepID=UPI0024119A4C|nr:LysR family transcriptional regulator [Latilactobacillus curvatus]MDG2979253.1 LysR family transcriptional regulator [Latilactobacillus curvatus]
MDLRVLNYFLTVAQERTISKAAAVLHLSQPTLSKQLKDLETELGVQLFTRGNREITLTTDGVYLQKRGREILSLVDATTNNLTHNQVVSGIISIGAGETQAFQLIAVIINDLRQRYPDINLQLFSGTADEVKERIDQGLLDFGLVIDPVDKQRYEFVRLPVSDHWGVLVADDHPIAAHSTVDAATLAQYPLLISGQSLVCQQISNWFGANLDQLDVVGTYTLLYNASLLVKTSNNAALCIDGIINTKENGLKFIPLNPPLTVNTNIIWKKGQVFSSASQVFKEALTNQTNQTPTH